VFIRVLGRSSWPPTPLRARQLDDRVGQQLHCTHSARAEDTPARTIWAAPPVTPATTLATPGIFIQSPFNYSTAPNTPGALRNCPHMARAEPCDDIGDHGYPDSPLTRSATACCQEAYRVAGKSNALNKAASRKTVIAATPSCRRVVG